MTAGGRAEPTPAVGRAAPPPTGRWGPYREGSRAPEVVPSAVHSPDLHSPQPHGGRLAERLVAPDRARDLAAEAAGLPAVALDGRDGRDQGRRLRRHVVAHPAAGR